MQGQKLCREQMTVAACCSPPLPARTDITIFESGVRKHVRDVPAAFPKGVKWRCHRSHSQAERRLAVQYVARSATIIPKAREQSSQEGAASKGRGEPGQDMQQEPITPPRTTRSASAGLQANQNSSQGPLGTSEAKEDSLHTSGTPYFRPARTPIYSDRFIPSRADSSRLQGYSLLDRAQAADEPYRNPQAREEGSSAYNHMLRTELLGINGLDTPTQLGCRSPMHSPVKKMFRFQCGDAASPIAGAPLESPYSQVGRRGGDGLGSPLASPKRAHRKIARSPFKVLDAPQLTDDFYLNLVDWSSQNVLAVGLGTCVYLWSACTSKVTKLCEFSGEAANSVCSVSWSQRGTYLSVGTNSGEVQIWDAAKGKLVRILEGHKMRVGTMAWSSHMLSTGSRDRAILQRDIRAPEDFQHALRGHRSEVCGLKWSPDDRQIASGGNDNQLYIWTQQSPNPVLKFSDHTAAVKAIAWSPHQHGLLASGGGTADRCIRFWNTTTSTALNHLDTGSQVCNLLWSKNANEIVSTHGYSQNQIIAWKYPSMTKLATLTGHTMRVLYLAVSPDGQTIVTGAGDETLRFWNVLPGPKSQSTGSEASVTTMMRTLIR
ncbi:Protein FIZZY-RELATED 2 [Coccomyxa viridis]|uniref:Protein FIZZY-RELATED 2 n=1 Tax=Coccomyxa viridis TaxID=1274662 RepID=A0AAV1IE79_9CHLO|nr:Protein FIZZY-RELATED 2 [Coccomyxa viridis]